MNITHVDPGALDWLQEIRPDFSFLDIGCGPMGMVDLALERGHDAWGVDADITLPGKVQHPDNLTIWDMNDGPYLYPASRLRGKPIGWDPSYDVVWSVEVVEHIPESSIINWVHTVYLNIKRSGLIIMSHATGPNSGSHVNCQPSEYWIRLLAKNNICYEPELTAQLKAHSTMQREFIKNTGMVFSRHD